MHQQVTVLILKTSSRKRASQWGQTAGEGSREGRSVLKFPLYSLVFHVPHPSMIPLLYSLTSHLTQEEHICYITATKLETVLRQGGSSCRPCPSKSESVLSPDVSDPVAINCIMKTVQSSTSKRLELQLHARKMPSHHSLQMAVLPVFLPIQQYLPSKQFGNVSIKA